jgi:hypothetical protein
VNGSSKNRLFIKLSQTLLSFSLVLASNIIFCQNNPGQSDADMVQEVFQKTTEVEDPNRQIGNLSPDSTANLPIGLVKQIGDIKYIIAIDSARFLADNAYFSAYAALEFPGTGQKVAFAAKNIQFNPKGVLGGNQAKLQLVSEHYIQLGPKTELYLPPDGSNYVEWDCNGFKAIHIHGTFRFSGEMLTPATGQSQDSVVTAEFEVHANDLQNVLAAVTFSPFSVRGMDDFEFDVKEATVDLSDYANPTSMIVPNGYTQAATDGMLWRGFYLKRVAVKFPEHLSPTDQQSELYVNNLIIDDAGVSGIFGVTNLFTTDQANIAGWGISLDDLSVTIVSNQLTEGKIMGDIEIPAFKNNATGTASAMPYEATMFQNSQTNTLDFQFMVSPQGTLKMEALKATLTIEPNSTIEVSKTANGFVPMAVLNGNLTVQEDNINLNQLKFQQFTLVTSAPYITNGIFSLTSTNGDGSKLAKFPLSLNNLQLGVNNGKVVLGADVGLSFDNPSTPNSFSAVTSVYVKTNITTDASGNEVWAFDQIGISGISLEINTQPFYLKGAINFYKDDPIYGKGFQGSLKLMIRNVMPDTLAMACAFGSKDDYRYWMVDASIPVNIPISIARLTSIRGGLSNHMVVDKSDEELISAASSSQFSGPGQTYIPDANIGIGFKVGAGFQHITTEDIFNGDIIFSVLFNASGGLDNIQFAGRAFMMVKRSQRGTGEKEVNGTITMLYDNVNKIFDAQLIANARFGDAITGSLWSHLYFSPDHWHIHIGSPSVPANITVQNLGTATAYLMFGQDLPPMPPPPANVTSILGTANLTDQRDEGASVTGNGLATGFAINSNFDYSLGWDAFNVYIQGGFGAGFDMTLYNYGPTAHCVGSTGDFGMGGWYLNGQLYSYISLNAGVAGRYLGMDFDLNLINASAAMVLSGKLPKPTYVQGQVALQATILGVFNMNLNAAFSLGTDCTVTTG